MEKIDLNNYKRQSTPAEIIVVHLAIENLSVIE